MRPERPAEDEGFLIWVSKSPSDSVEVQRFLEQLDNGPVPQESYPQMDPKTSHTRAWLSKLVAIIWALMVLLFSCAIVFGATTWDEVSAPFTMVNTVLTGVLGFFIGRAFPPKSE